VAFGLPLAAVAILAAACGGGSTPSASSNITTTSAAAPTTTSSQTSTAPATSAAPAMTVKTGTGTAGTFLTDSNGKTLYIFTADKGTTSSCYGACATAWPPLVTTGSVGVSGAAVAADLGTTQRTDGTTQVTYAGHPLYYFQKDTSAGMTTGQGVQGVWFLLAPSGTAIKPPAAPPPATQPKSGGGGSGGGGGGGGWA
jgi:predicted lipoprotein with Yx(FWY)xxD motif